MSAEFLSTLAGTILSLAFSYVPGVSSWYEQLEGTQKRFVMLGALLAVAIGVFALSCIGIYDYVTCNQTGVTKLAEVFFAALVANQAVYLVSPKK